MIDLPVGLVLREFTGLRLGGSSAGGIRARTQRLNGRR